VFERAWDALGLGWLRKVVLVLTEFFGEEGRLLNGVARPRFLRWRDVDLDVDVSA